MERTHNLQRQATDKSLSGWINGFIGVVIFSGSLPATRVAVLEFDPVFLTVARKRPETSQLVPLLIVALGVVVGFPLLTALALQHVTSAHSIVFLGMFAITGAVILSVVAAKRFAR